MTPHTIKTTARDDDVSNDSLARERRIQNRILDGIEETLDDMAQPRLLQAAIVRDIRSRCAALLCRQALCRRTRRCRSQPCRVPAATFRKPG